MPLGFSKICVNVGMERMLVKILDSEASEVSPNNIDVHQPSRVQKWSEKLQV